MPASLTNNRKTAFPEIYIQYDAGELVDKIDTIEVSKKDAEKAQIGEEEAYSVILKYQK